MATIISAALAFELSGAAVVRLPQTQDRPPAEIQPWVPKPGVLLTALHPGTVKPFSTPNEPGAGAQTDRSGSGGVDKRSKVGSMAALSAMLAKPWGATAADNALALGVKPSALAATCVVESDCREVGGSGSITGAFQMSAATYTEMINKAMADNPGFAGQIVPGLAGQSHPTTQSIAAAEYLLQGAETLRNAGIYDPTVLDVRAYYNFGPTNGLALATADPQETMAAVMPNVSARTLAKNGVNPGQTVGQWRASVSAKIGDAANQSVLGGDGEQIFSMLRATVRFLSGLA